MEETKEIEPTVTGEPATFEEATPSVESEVTASEPVESLGEVSASE